MRARPKSLGAQMSIAHAAPTGASLSQAIWASRQMPTEPGREPLSSEVRRLESEVGPHAHHPLLHFRVFEQLKHRNVIRVGILYLVVCWLILDPVHVLFHMLEVPVWANRLVVILMAIAFPAVLLFAWVYEITPEGLRLTAEVDPQRSIRQQTGQRLNRAIFVVLVLAVAYLLTDKFWLSKHVTIEQPATIAAPVATAIAPAAIAISDKSVAVLPFVDMSEKKDQEYFADGLAEELLDLLAQVPDLKVPARSSSFFFKGSSVRVRNVGHDLGVAYVLEGGVRKAGDTIRVSVQLVRADSGYQVWSHTYERNVRDIFKVQDEISAAVVDALKLRLSSPGPQLAERRTASPEAYDQYLRGKHFYQLGNYDGLLAARDAFRKAIELDPNFGPAFAGLANAEYLTVKDFSDTDQPDVIRQAMEHADHAVALGSSAGRSILGSRIAAIRPT